jgi:hypothetical protein
VSPMLHRRQFGGRYMGLWVGSHGCGKTVAIGSMPGPILIFDFDGRIDPLIDFYPRRTDIEFFTVGLSDDARHDVIGLKKFAEMFEQLQTDCPYGTVAIDSYTMYSTTSVLYQMGHRDNATLKRTKGGIAIPDWDEFKGETGLAVQIMEVAKIIPAHFIMTAHPVTKAQTTKQGGTTNEVLASMIKATTLQTYGWKTGSFLPCYFNEMYFFYNEASTQIAHGVRYFVQTVASGEIVAKSAMGLPAKFEITKKAMWPILGSLIEERKQQIAKIRQEVKADDIPDIWNESDLSEREVKVEEDIDYPRKLSPAEGL